VGKLLLVLLVGLVLSLLLVCWLLYVLTGGMCDNQIIQEVYSPNGQYKVVVYERNCGATTPYTTQISLLKSHVALGDRAGNLLGAEGHPDWFMIEVEWQDDQHLVIEYDGELAPRYVKRPARGIDVQFIENVTPIPDELAQ
jgi:hypothetical protein